MLTITIDTPHGPAAAHLHPVPAPRGALVLGHGAGGSVAARDLLAVTTAANEAGFTVALVEQPYRVAGRRAPPRAPMLDVAWTAVVQHLRRTELGEQPIVVGGR
ncbi:alpha/beta family hydrolase, partial [Pengzhenrongella sp.]|uniref:alpha/beta family hydrolase n=1 Tax=Pengzhenrongella sp. TaxID=2888820 RepID=UPI002F9358A2